MKISEHELKQLLIDIDFVCHYMGSDYGAHDCIDNNGTSYPSSYWHDKILEEIKRQGFKPSKNLLKWSTSPADSGTPEK